MTALRLLLVEDDPVDRRLFEELLRESGIGEYVLRTADRVSSAVKALHEAIFDVVLTDLSLPDGYGRETVERLRAAAATMPIVVLTGSEHPDFGAALAELGISLYVPKHNMTPPLLLQTLRRAAAVATAD